MRNQNDNDIGTTEFPDAWKTKDTLSVREQAHYLRQVEMARFFGQVARMLIKLVVGWNKRRTLSRELSTMPDYLLKDIGLSRWEIPAVVSGELGRKTLAPSAVIHSPAPASTGNEDARNETPSLAA